LHFTTVLFVALLCLKLIKKSFKDLKDYTRRLSNRLGSLNYTLWWRSPGYDQIFLNAFIAGAKKLVRERIITRPRLPLTTAQMFCVIVALIPPSYQELGLHTDHIKNEFLSRASVISIILFLCDGLRGGELLAPKQKDLTVKQLEKVPRISNVKFTFKSSPRYHRISDYTSKKQQLKFLKRIASDLSCVAILTVFATKPGRTRRIALEHYHILNSQILCPLCHFATYMAYRLQQNSTYLKRAHNLFIFEGVAGEWFPVTGPIFNKTLVKVCSDMGLLKITKSNFKIGILTELWETSIKETLPFQPGLRFFLEVADHRTDYHQHYILPELRTICEGLQMVRGINLLRFLGSLTGEERNDLNFKIICLLPSAVKNTSSIAFQAKMGKTEIKEASVRCKLLFA